MPSDITRPSILKVWVTNPAPGGGDSNVVLSTLRQCRFARAETSCGHGIMKWGVTRRPAPILRLNQISLGQMQDEIIGSKQDTASVYAFFFIPPD